jgi:endonuclease/exonuclease/phosphatase family metal-dependent hydrolase
MKNRILTISVITSVALLILILLNQDVPVSSFETYQIGTFNISFLGDGLSSGCSWTAKNNIRSEEELVALAVYIDSLDLEIIAIQEVENESWILLLSKLLGPRYDAIISHQEICQRTAFIYRKDRFQMQLKDEIETLNVSFGQRNGLVGEVTNRITHEKFFVVNVHLDCCPTEDSSDRNEQISQLNNWLKQSIHVNSEFESYILLGDFNEHLHKHNSILQRLINGLDLKLISADITPMSCDTEGNHYPDVIDHILISGNQQSKYSGKVVLENYFENSEIPYRYSFSDHCVVWAEFTN